MMNLNTPIRALQAMLSITLLGISGYVTHWYITHTIDAICPYQLVVMITVATLSLLTMPYLFFNPPLQITRGNRTSNPRFFNKWAVLGLDVVIAVLWFVAWIDLAIFHANLRLCFGHVCKFMGAGAGLGALASILYLATATLAALHVLRTRGSKQSSPENHAAWVGTEKNSNN